MKWVVNCLHSSFHDSMDSLFKLLYHVISLFRSVLANSLHLTAPRTLRYLRIVFMFLICSFGFVVLSYGSICGGFFNPIEIWVSWILLVKGLRRPLSSSFGVEDRDWQGFPIGWCLVPLQKKKNKTCLIVGVIWGMFYKTPANRINDDALIFQSDSCSLWSAAV